jgi:riboflavin synthase
MFTGIVSAIGLVEAVDERSIAIADAETASRLQIGASVAVNGCCLTVTSVDAGTFSADVVPETRRRTNLGALLPGDPVNLELPVTAGGSLDGHLVQGHVDGVSQVVKVEPAATGREVTFGLPPGLARYVAEKGPIAVDGTSLTVASVDGDSFRVALIPHTLQATIAGSYRPGALVNLEVDVLARYAERLLRLGTE